MRRTLLLLSVLLTTSLTWAQTGPGPLVGAWQGDLTLPTGKLPLSITFRAAANDTYTATLDVPQQNVQALPIPEVSRRGDSVLLALPALQVRVVSALSADRKHLTGYWLQRGYRAPLTLTHATGAATTLPASNRSQTPKGPFPYRTEDITFPNKGAGIRLAGTLTVPTGKGPFPAVVLLTGSGPEDRNETIFGHQPFLVLADYLTRRGMAVLRFDDRGVGKSEGNLATATSADYATDAQAALTYLRTLPTINKQQMGLIGHSEGGTAAIRAAGQPQGPAFLVLLATPGLPGTAMMVEQVQALARLQTTDTAQVAAIGQMQHRLLDIVQQTPDNDLARTRLLTLLDPTGAAPTAVAQQLNQQITLLTSPGYRALLADNPAQTLRAVKCPVLALGGARDVQVNATTNLAAIQKGLTASGNHNVTVRELPGLNHLFQTSSTGSPAEYGRIEETFAPAALQAIGDWLVKTTK